MVTYVNKSPDIPMATVT